MGLEIPQYVAYQKNVVYAFIKLSAKSHSFNILCTMDGLSCPTITRRVEIFFFKRMLRNGSNMIFLRIHRDPPWPLSVKPHTTGLNLLSILTKQCIRFNPTHWYLNIPLDQTHPFLKGFYLLLRLKLPLNVGQCS